MSYYYSLAWQNEVGWESNWWMDGGGRWWQGRMMAADNNSENDNSEDFFATTMVWLFGASSGCPCQWEAAPVMGIVVGVGRGRLGEFSGSPLAQLMRWTNLHIHIRLANLKRNIGCFGRTKKSTKLTTLAKKILQTCRKFSPDLGHKCAKKANSEPVSDVWDKETRNHADSQTHSLQIWTIRDTLPPCLLWLGLIWFAWYFLQEESAPPRVHHEQLGVALGFLPCVVLEATEFSAKGRTCWIK